MSAHEEIVGDEIVVPAAPDHLRRAPRAVAALNRAIVFGACALLIFGPLAFGATEDWSQALLQTGAAVLFLVWVVKQVVAGRVKLRYNALFPPMALFAAVVAAQLLFGLSAYGYATYSEAMRYLSYGVLFFLVNHCFRTEEDLRVVAIGLSVFGFLLATFAIIHGFTDHAGKLYWLRSPRDPGWTYGPYVNHNHYAGLMEMLVPIPLVLALRGDAAGGKRVIVSLAATVMAASIFLSQSRGGIAAFAVQAAVLGAWVMARDRSRRLVLGLAVAVLLLASAVAWLGGAEVGSRLATLAQPAGEVAAGSRLQITRDGLAMFLDRPLLGYGFGTFPSVYPQFRSFYTNYFVNHAHNDWLQVLVETGVLGGVAVVWFVVMLYRSAFRRLRAREYGLTGAMTLAALLGCTGLLVHSATDFNLHIPANAALFFALCALASGRLERSRRLRRRAEPPLLFAEDRENPWQT